jgi:hypothetical protein
MSSHHIRNREGLGYDVCFLLLRRTSRYVRRRETLRYTTQYFLQLQFAYLCILLLLIGKTDRQTTNRAEPSRDEQNRLHTHASRTLYARERRTPRTVNAEVNTISSYAF